VTSTDVWAVGWYGDKGSHRSLIEHWDGRAWSVIPVPNGSDRYAALSSISPVAADDVWAIGYDGGRYFSNIVLHWDGSSWKRVEVPPLLYGAKLGVGLHPLITGVEARGPDDVWIAATAQPIVKEGHHLRAPGQVPYFVHWDGSRWSGQRASVPSGSSVSLNGIAGSPRGIWAVGFEQGVSPVTRPVVYSLIGGTWETVPSPTIPPAPMQMDDFRVNQLESISVDRRGNAWAVGTYFSAKSKGNLPLVEWHCPPGR